MWHVTTTMQNMLSKAWGNLQTIAILCTSPSFVNYQKLSSFKQFKQISWKVLYVMHYNKILSNEVFKHYIRLQWIYENTNLFQILLHLRPFMSKLFNQLQLRLGKIKFLRFMDQLLGQVIHPTLIFFNLQ